MPGKRTDLTKLFLGRRNDPQVQFPIGCLSLLLLILLLISIGSKQEQETDLDLRLFSEENSRFSEFCG